MVLRLVLGKKDSVLREWFICAREEDINVSHVISKAVEYYVRTREYLQIGTIEKEDNSDKIDRNIYYQKGSVLDIQIKKWQEKGIHPSSEVKRILRKGIMITGETTVIDEIDAYDAVEAISDEKPETYVRPNNGNKKTIEQKPVENSVKKTEKKEVKTSKTTSNPATQPPANFVTSMIAVGCGLGED